MQELYKPPGCNRVCMCTGCHQPRLLQLRLRRAGLVVSLSSQGGCLLLVCPLHPSWWRSSRAQQALWAQGGQEELYIVLYRAPFIRAKSKALL